MNGLLARLAPFAGLGVAVGLLGLVTFVSLGVAGLIFGFPVMYDRSGQVSPPELTYAFLAIGCFNSCWIMGWSLWLHRRFIRTTGKPLIPPLARWRLRRNLGSFQKYGLAHIGFVWTAFAAAFLFTTADALLGITGEGDWTTALLSGGMFLFASALSAIVLTALGVFGFD